MEKSKLPLVKAETLVNIKIYVVRKKKIMLIFSKIREMLIDTLSMKLDIEEIKRRLSNQDKNLELVFSYLDELIEKQETPTSRKPIGFKRNAE